MWTGSAAPQALHFALAADCPTSLEAAHWGQKTCMSTTSIAARAVFD
jgi:hypothetical protein